MAFDKYFFIAQFEKYPELLTFLSPDVDATADYNPEQMSPWMLALYEAASEYLPTAQGEDFPTPIKDLLKKSQPDKRSFELERTMLCLMSYHSVVLKDYSFFEKSPVMFGGPITRDQFNCLCELLNISEVKGIVELELVVGDLGKIRPLRQHICKIEGIEAQDPDQFIEALLQKGQDVCVKYLPTINDLSVEDFSELIKINTGFHYGHFAHAESTERALAKLKIVIEERGLKYLSLNMLVQCLDVAGASAHAGGKILLNNIIAATYLNCIFPTLQRLQSETPETIYLSYLRDRLDQCGLSPEPSTPFDDSDRLLARLLCMFRITEEKQARELKGAIEQLKESSEFMCSLSTIASYENNPAFQTPTYMPALLVALKESEEVRKLADIQGKKTQEIALGIGLKLIAHCLDSHAKLVEYEKANPNIPVNFNGLTRLVKEDFQSLETLQCQSVALGSDGYVYPSLWVLSKQTNRLHDYVSLGEDIEIGKLDLQKKYEQHLTMNSPFRVALQMTEGVNTGNDIETTGVPGNGI